MCSTNVAIFLCLSQLTPLPSRVTFVNLDMRGKELRKMTLHLFSLKEGKEDNSKKLAISSEAEKDLKNIESQLMNVIMTPKPLPIRHKSIVELSQKMDGYRKHEGSDGADRKSVEDVSAQMAHSIQSLRPEVLLPTAIFAACCDMSTIGDRPFMSLSQFVNFTWNRIQESEDSQESEEELHQVIFQRYCLAFSDREQLLFQTFIMLHYGILNGNLSEDDLKDFLNVVAGHDKKDFAIACPDWSDPADWHHLKKIISEKNYHYAVRSLEEKEADWKHWYENTLDQGSEDNDFVSFLIKCALRHRLLPIHLSKFVTSRITPAMQVPSNLCLDYVHSFSTSTSPILLFIDKSAVEDPTFYLKKLADVQGIASTKVKYFALGAGNGALACSLLDTAFVRGQWLIFQNLQLVPNIIVALQRRIGTYNLL